MASGPARQDLGRFQQLRRRLLFAFGIDDLGAPLALGLGLARDGADHGLGNVDVLDLDVGHLDAPGIGLGIEDLLNVVVELVAFGQHLVQLVLAEHRAQRRLGKLAGRIHEVLDLDGGALGSTTRK
jgi:hypothetical protein